MTVLLEYGTKRRKRMQKLMFENVKKCGPCSQHFFLGGKEFLQLPFVCNSLE